MWGGRVITPFPRKLLVPSMVREIGRKCMNVTSVNILQHIIGGWLSNYVLDISSCSQCQYLVCCVQNRWGMLLPPNLGARCGEDGAFWCIPANFLGHWDVDRKSSIAPRDVCGVFTLWMES